MKISFITTVFNEEKTISKFLDSLFVQTKMPDEVIIVDGGSSDQTVKIINEIKLKNKNYRGKFVVLVKKGNRSVGRNEAITHASGEIILCSDAGNTLDQNWIKNVSKPFANSQVDVVAGYYQGIAKNVFQKCVIPYALVMPDKVDPDNFLPATRSVAFKKSTWKKVGGFDERFSHNEDYVFAQKLRDANAKIIFAKDAIVYWMPRDTFKQAFIMMFRFALGDAEAGIFRSKVLFLFTRYILGLYFLFLVILYKSLPGALVILLGCISYLLWAITKNYRYVKAKPAIVILPLLQLTADAAIIFGTLIGIVKTIMQFNVLKYLRKNKFFFFTLCVYTLLLLSIIKWGVPNQNHPFPYFMDEWHMFHAVGTTFTQGTPNVAGSANGTMFIFLLSGFYLVPFILLHLVNPLHLSITDAVTREHLFELLRTNTLLFGILTMFVLYNTARLMRISAKLVLSLFTFTPIWLMLSNYFKYDIALVFWIVLSLYLILRFAKDPNLRNYIIAAIPVIFGVSTKISALPLIPMYIFAYFWFYSNWKKELKSLLLGFFAVILGIILFAIPDTLFGKGNILGVVYTNVISNPGGTSNLKLGMNVYQYLFTTSYIVIFGLGLMILFFLSVLVWMYLFLKKGLQKSIHDYKVELFLWVSFLLFLLSLIPLKIGAAGNRSLVLLPFFTLLIVSAYKKIAALPKYRIWLLMLTVIFVTMQLYESFAWLAMRFYPPLKETSSTWILQNIPPKTTIGIENIPIYQYLPDIVEKEVYFKVYNITQKNMYQYLIIDSNSASLPATVIITNAEFEKALYIQSPKNDLVARLNREGYKKIREFSQSLSYPHIYGNDIDNFIVGLAASPLTITVYKK